MTLSASNLVVLFATGLAAGFVDSIAGGGGLITVPVLMSFGLPAQQALGTNKLQASFGSGTAAARHLISGTVKATDCVRGFVLTCLGAAAGTLTVQRVDPGFLRRAVVVLLVTIAVFLLVRPQLGTEPGRRRLGHSTFDWIFGLGLGFYDGFFGPGTGTFWAMACMLVMGHTMIRATGYTKVMNFGSNISSLFFFLLGGNVVFVAGMVMGAGQLAGAWIGSHMVVTRGTRFIRPLFLIVVLALCTKLLIDSWRQ